MMKKYLIASAVALLASCMHETEPIEIQKEKEKTFESNFNSTFGVSESVYANHEWGTNFIPLVDFTNNIKTRVANTNGNEWGTANGAGYLDYPHPDAITKDELDAVLDVFNQKGK